MRPDVSGIAEPSKLGLGLNLFSRGLKRNRILLALTMICLGCDNGTAPLDLDRIRLEDLIGAYVAEEFTATIDGEVLDVLDAGGEVSLTLNLNGSTSGHLFVPAVIAGEGTDVDADLEGTFAFDEIAGTLRLEHDTDTFLRDIDLIPSRTATAGIELVGAGTFAGATVQVLLRRS